MSFGTKGWAGMLLYVLAFDLYAIYTDRETLSGAFYNAVLHPRQRWVVIVLWFYITAHLFNLIPHNLDPLRRWELPFKE